ncbi:MAG: hypothetical protein M3Y88_05345 [Chloroflexota bacterium]|nr:hypothetical protein [Chloroflexota bacterium]
MPVVQIEHAVRDFETWKAAFDRDPVRREESGVRRYQIYRPIDDPNYIVVDLELDSRDEAEAFKRSLEELWASPVAAPALGGNPQARIIDVVESKVY